MRGEIWRRVWDAVHAAAAERGVEFEQLGEEITRLYARQAAERLSRSPQPDPAELAAALVELRELVHRMADHAQDRRIDTRAHALARAEFRPRRPRGDRAAGS